MQFTRSSIAQSFNSHHSKEPSMKSMSTLIPMTAFALAFTVSSGALAQAATGSGKSVDMKTEQPAAVVDMTEGVVLRVNPEVKKITIKHGAIKNLDMPGMTMVFQVRDPAAFDKVQKGDKVKFRAEMAGSVMVVTEIQVVK